MRSSNESYTINLIRADIFTGKITFDHKLQRKVGQWNNHQKSLLIDSIIKGYSMNLVFIAVDQYERQYVIDGVQRLSTIYDFMKGEFRLSKDLEPVTLVTFDKDGNPKLTPFEIAGKKYDRLDEEVKQIINKYQISVKVISNYSEKELKEMFLRLNNATPMNKTQKTVVLFEDRMFDYVLKALDHNFWMKAGITPTDVKKDADRQILLQTLYAIYCNGEDTKGFKQPQIDAFIKDIQNGSDEVVKAHLIALFGKLFDVIDALEAEWDKPVIRMNKISIPCLVASAIKIRGNKLLLKNYAQEVKDFFENQYVGSEYEQLCQGSGTASSNHVNTRIKFFDSIVEDVKVGRKFVAPIVQVAEE